MIDFARGSALLIGFFFLGEGTHRLGSPIPGGVAGLLLLFFALQLRLIKLEWLDNAANFFLRHMVLLFVPATVALMDAVGVLRQSGLALAVTLVASFFVTLSATGLLARWLLPYDANSLAEIGGKARGALEKRL